MTQPKERIILGIDPGTTIMGYGIVRAIGSKAELIVLGNIELKKYSNHYVKLQHIFKRCCELIENYHPDELAIEAPFFGKNVQSMLKLGRAQGVAMSAALNYDIPITEYAPLKIKMAITGHGGASKEQVAQMLSRILKVPFSDFPTDLDATDGLAAAVCHVFQTDRPVSEKKYSSWKDFATKNSSIVKGST